MSQIPPAKFTLLVTLDLDHWSAARRTAVSERRSSGRTSIRVSRSTLAAVRELARHLRNIAREQSRDDWRVTAPNPDELIAALAAAAVRAGHAEPAGTKGMRRSSTKARR